jgi:hypothetical protein
MLKGLPIDECHCPHWGYALQRSVTFTEAGTEYLQFSPAKEMAEVEQQITKNMEAMQAEQT